MLVLSRKAGESLVLANNIRVTVVDCGAGGVRLGIEAPREISVLRAELHDEIGRANMESRESSNPPATLVDRLRSSLAAPEPPARTVGGTRTRRR